MSSSAFDLFTGDMIIAAVIAGQANRTPANRRRFLAEPTPPTEWH
jgi:hypothetical protein